MARDYRAEYARRKERARAEGFGGYWAKRSGQQPTRKPPQLSEEVYSGVEAGMQHDLGPWIETPQSSRVSRFRFDHLQRQLQVQWRNNKNQGYIYENVDYEGYRAFARVASKGRYINVIDKSLVYRPMVPSEYDAPSNENRRGIGSRLRT